MTRRLDVAKALLRAPAGPRDPVGVERAMYFRRAFGSLGEEVPAQQLSPPRTAALLEFLRRQRASGRGPAA